jgi:hypothetical protein
MRETNFPLPLAPITKRCVARVALTSHKTAALPAHFLALGRHAPGADHRHYLDAFSACVERPGFLAKGLPNSNPVKCHPNWV